jgi:hypothetical protein
MQELIIWDIRLSGKRPRGEEVAEVNQSIPLDYAIAWTAMKSGQYGGDVNLKILAHGFETGTGFLAGSRGGWEVSQPRLGADGRPVATPTSSGLLGVYSQGGNGIQCCQEGILLSTISKFGVLRGKLKKIEILGCGAAYITPGCEGREGDGNLLCYRLAQIAQTSVRASSATQLYDPDGPIDFGAWEGTVLTYGPSGAVIKVEQAPAQ